MKVIYQQEMKPFSERLFSTYGAIIKTTSGSCTIELDPTVCFNKESKIEDVREYVEEWKRDLEDFPYIVKHEKGLLAVNDKTLLSIEFRVNINR